MFDRGEVFRKLALNVSRYSGLAALAKPLVGGIGAILMLHRVTAAPAKPLGINRHLSITPEFLDQAIEDMKSRGYQFVSMDETIDRIRSGHADEQFATITADDAYRDNLTEALPVFEKHGAPFTIYVAPGLIDGATDLWWDVLEDVVGARDRIDLLTPNGKTVIDASTPARKIEANQRLENYLTGEVPEEEQRVVLRDLARQAGVDFDLPRRETLMDWNEIRTIAGHPLATIGAHTVHHYNQRRLPADKVRQEMVDGARMLKDELGTAPRHFAYPYGYTAAVGPREVGIAREAGYTSAVTTRHGILRPEHAGHLHALPRISLNGRYQHIGHLRTMLSGITTPLANSGKVVVTV
ncbi:polysaccharide deacetylase family protein [Mesorhizobium sp. ZC-5]|uniref:polysaccharide deacetylase family protein n=1 Tax=Mesorhizobium sp. ZC-5 TaxID=2986066 RepID=UPI0021E7607B|nr:polysaccharide deacetylase family protein [Mesorhizobium sp. ZC-5]MCV3240343.1 polysaccharide deacetylase family protein [Mesorhizobium sp. ZC-5]